MKVITVVENSKAESSTLLERHGLGLYIEHNGKRLFFDNGPDDAFVFNAQEIGIDVASVDAYILSHAHYDHGGGLSKFLEMNSHAPVYLLNAARGNYYSKGPEAFRYIGLNQEMLKTHADRFHYFEKEMTLFNSVYLRSITERSGFLPASNRTIYKEINGQYINDDFQHELVLAITENGRNTVFTGCAHNGILNMLYAVKEVMPSIPIYTLIGGFHFVNVATKKLAENPETVEKIAHALVDFDIKKIYTGHCTGEEGYMLLKQVLGDSIMKLHTGIIIE